MGAALDGQNLFDGQQLEIEPGSIRRDSIERAVAGLDGVLSIDLGSRSRQIKQKGVLRAKSRAQMEEKISAISACMDGDTHTLSVGGGDIFENVRVDVFKVGSVRTGGGGIEADYEIIYAQMV